MKLLVLQLTFLESGCQHRSKSWQVLKALTTADSTDGVFSKGMFKVRCWPLINLHKELPQCQNYSWQEDKSCSTRTDEASSSSTLQIELSGSGILWQPQKLCCEREGYICHRNLRRYWNVPLDENPDIELKITGVNLSLWTWLTVAPLPALEVFIFCRVQRNLCKIFISFWGKIFSAFTSSKSQSQAHL